MTETRRADILAVTLMGLLPTLLFADVLLGINSLYTRDITNYYYPAKKVLREIVLSGHFPYWNSWFSAGQPLAANPEHEVFYPLTWLILLPRYDVAFHLLILAHVYIALFGMFALLRSLELSHPSAVLGAVSFGLGGVVLSSLDLTPCLFSMAWVPLTCLFSRRFLIGHAPRDAVLASLFLALQLLIGEPATAFQTGILLGMYALYRGVHDGGGARTVLKRVASIGLISLGALFAGAVQVLPALDHFYDSVRSRGLEFYIVGYWSAPFARIAELLYPNLIGQLQPDGSLLYWARGLYDLEKRPYFISIYGGMLVAVLLAAGLIARVRGSGLMAAVGATSLILAAGRHTPLLGILFDSGVANWLRFPEKFLFMGTFGAIIFAAVVLERVLQGDSRARKTALWASAVTTLFALLAFFLSLSSDSVSASSREGWLLAFARGAFLLILFRSLNRVSRRTWLTLLGIFVVLDLIPITPVLVPRVPSSFHREPPLVERAFPEQREAFRIFHQAAWNRRHPTASLYTPYGEGYWTTRNAFAPMMPATWGLRTVMEMDYDRTHLLPTADFTDSAWDLSAKRPRDWGDVIASMSNIWFVGLHRPPEEAIALARGDARAVQPVRFVELAHSPRYYFASRLVTIRDREDFVRTLIRTPDPRGIACIEAPAFTPAHGVVDRWTESPNGAQLDVFASGRAFLVMSVTPHKYWRVTIDGANTKALVTNVGYQGVIVPPGPHVVRMQYRNPLIAVGGLVSVATLLAMALLVRRATIRAR